MTPIDGHYSANVAGTAWRRLINFALLLALRSWICSPLASRVSNGSIRSDWNGFEAARASGVLGRIPH